MEKNWNCRPLNRQNRGFHYSRRIQLIFDEIDTTGNPFYHFAFNIPSNKFEEAFQWMQTRVDLLWLDDYKSYIADFTNWNAKSFYFTDPAGNILEFISRFDLDDIAAEPFSAAQSAM